MNLQIAHSERWWWMSVVVSGFGLVDALYLSWLKLAHQTAICSTIGDCETVNNSAYSEIGGIPIALLGAGAYLVILLVLFLENRVEFFQAYGKEVNFGLTLLGVLFSAWLTYVEIAILKAICPFCVISAIALLILLVLTVMRLFEPGLDEVSRD